MNPIKPMNPINPISPRPQPYKALHVLLCVFILSQVSNAISSEGQPKLFEPYAPKPSGKSPEGWEIKILEGSQVENSTTLGSGKDIKVTVPAYEIVAKASTETIIIKDPGFDPALGTTQKATIGAILTDYSEAAIELQNRLEKVSKELEVGLGTDTNNNTTDGEAEAEATPSETPKQDKKKPDDKKKSNSTSR